MNSTHDVRNFAPWFVSPEGISTALLNSLHYSDAYTISMSLTYIPKFSNYSLKGEQPRSYLGLAGHFGHKWNF